jgi:shikimate dehydrogenase
MIRLGLIGYPLSHSLSPRLHAAAFASLGVDGEYRLYPVAPEDHDGLARLVEDVRKGGLQGLNVTIPHKQAVLPLLEKLSPSAKSIGAVNTIYLKDDKLIGHNTDAPGFLSDLHKSVPNGFSEKKALVLGAGGAARAVVYALLVDKWTVTLAVRRADVEQAAALIMSIKQGAGYGSMHSVLLDPEELNPLVDGIRLVVNTTPVGMFPEVGYSPWPQGLQFPGGAVVYDLVYNPRETRLIQQARAAGLVTVSGIGMLVEQAALSFETWTGRMPSRDRMFSAVEEK